MKLNSLVKEALIIIKGAVTGASKAAAAIAVSVYSFDNPSKLVAVGAGLVLGGLVYSLYKKS